MKKITIALIGGGFAANFHANAYSKVSGVQVRIKTLVDIDLEKANMLAAKWHIENVTDDYAAVLADSEIDAVDIVLPPHLHLPFAFRALKAGKHVICEKPLTGYFGDEGDVAPIGKTVPKSKMYKTLLEEINNAREIIQNSGKLFLYAENYIYTPNIVRAGEIARKKGSKILYMKGEESNIGSTSPVAGQWDKTGGGSLIRMGCHPISGMLWLKQQEAIGRGETITVKSVIADMGCVSAGLNEYDRRHLTIHPVDVEDFSTVTITFSDGTKAVAMANDNTLGGVRNYIEVYSNDGAMNCLITPADNMSTYFLDEDGLDGVYISEMLPQKRGWNKVFISEETLRGYLNEFQDFAECIADGHQPQSGIDIAYDTIKVIYAAYLSAEEGRRVDL
jgi:predicted dehydrogenase